MSCRQTCQRAFQGLWLDCVVHWFRFHHPPKPTSLLVQGYAAKLIDPTQPSPRFWPLPARGPRRALKSCSDLTRHLPWKIGSASAMAFHGKHKSTAFRLFAAAALLLWMSASALCIQHCAGLSFTGRGLADCCSANKTGASQSTNPGAKAICGGLKMAKLEAKAALAEPEKTVSPAALPFPSFSLSEIHVGPHDVGSLRHNSRTAFVFRPEVCLGAALRSLAPPSLA